MISLGFYQHMGEITPKPLCFLGSGILFNKDPVFLSHFPSYQEAADNKRT